jgi:hypothetical protein
VVQVLVVRQGARTLPMAPVFRQWHLKSSKAQPS